MRAVRVHLHDGVVAPVERRLEARDVGGPQARLGAAVQHVDALVRGIESVGDLPGPVGDVVVDDEQARGGTADRPPAVMRRMLSLSLYVGIITAMGPVNSAVSVMVPVSFIVPFPRLIMDLINVEVHVSAAGLPY